MREPGRVDVVPLFLPLHEELVRLLSGLSAADWERPTVAGTWRVRDVAAHLLDTDLRRISSSGTAGSCRSRRRSRDGPTS